MSEAEPRGRRDLRSTATWQDTADLHFPGFGPGKNPSKNGHVFKKLAKQRAVTTASKMIVDRGTKRILLRETSEADAACFLPTLGPQGGQRNGGGKHGTTAATKPGAMVSMP